MSVGRTDLNGVKTRAQGLDIESIALTGWSNKGLYITSLDIRPPKVGRVLQDLAQGELQLQHIMNWVGVNLEEVVVGCQLTDADRKARGATFPTHRVQGIVSKNDVTAIGEGGCGLGTGQTLG